MPISKSTKQIHWELENARLQLYRLIEDRPGVTIDEITQIAVKRFAAPIIRAAIMDLVSKGAIEMREPDNTLYEVKNQAVKRDL